MYGLNIENINEMLYTKKDQKVNNIWKNDSIATNLRQRYNSAHLYVQIKC